MKCILPLSSKILSLRILYKHIRLSYSTLYIYEYLLIHMSVKLTSLPSLKDIYKEQYAENSAWTSENASIMRKDKIT
jgi:hypothetical protein